MTCAMLSDYWDSPVTQTVTNLSCSGLWVETAFPLEAGHEVVVSLTPPRLDEPLVAAARVARTDMNRRRSDRAATGMGLEFVGLCEANTRALTECLRGVPPPLPLR